MPLTCGHGVVASNVKLWLTESENHERDLFPGDGPQYRKYACFCFTVASSRMEHVLSVLSDSNDSTVQTRTVHYTRGSALFS